MGFTRKVRYLGDPKLIHEEIEHPDKKKFDRLSEKPYAKLTNEEMKFLDQFRKSRSDLKVDTKTKLDYDDHNQVRRTFPLDVAGKKVSKQILNRYWATPEGNYVFDATVHDANQLVGRTFYGVRCFELIDEDAAKNNILLEELMRLRVELEELKEQPEKIKRPGRPRKSEEEV